MAISKNGKAPQVQLATLVKEIPKGDEWIFELKYDGYRLLGVKGRKEVSLYTRNGLDWTGKFANIATELASALPPNTVVDGEVVAKGKGGKISFSELQKSLNEGSRATLSYYVFDVLTAAGKDVRDKALQERRKILKAALKTTKNVLLSPQYSRKQLDQLLRRVQEQGLEGVMAKRATRPYRAGRSDDWVKYKFNKHEEFVIIGYSPHSKQSDAVGSVLLGLPIDAKNYWYCGKVGTGFSTADRDALYTMLTKGHKKNFALVNSELVPRKSVLAPSRLVCEVEFTEWTHDGLLRHPSFLGLRPDKSSKELSIKNSSHPFVK